MSFFYDRKCYSLTAIDSNAEKKTVTYAFLESNKPETEVIVQNEAVFDVDVNGKRLRDIVTEIAPYFRSM